MKFIKKNWTFFVLGILCVLLWKSCNQDPEYIEVPIKIEVPIPIIEKEFDTIYLPEPIKGDIIIDSTYYKEYLKLKDSVARDSSYKEAISIREYRPFVEDDSIRIDIYSKVRGTLLESQVTYKTKPRNISLDTTIKIKVPKKAELYYGAQLTSPTDLLYIKNIGIGPSASFINKKHTKLYSGSYDFINKNASFKIELRF